MADPSLSDRCIYAEAAAGDGGTHNQAGVWWVSPDILLNDPALSSVPAGTTPGTARENPNPNAVGVRVHKKTECTVTGAGTPPKVQVDLFVCVPAAVIPVSSAIQVGDDVIDVPTLTVAGTIKQFGNWVAGTDPAKGDGPGHKCMIARVYPQLQTPDPGNFHVTDPDQHYVQRNICIQPCTEEEGDGAVGGAGTGIGGDEALPADQDGLHKFRFLTVNRAKRAAVAVLSVRANPRPDPKVVRAAAAALKRLEIPARPLDRPPKHTGIQVNRIPQLDGVRVGKPLKPAEGFWKGGTMIPMDPKPRPTTSKRLTLRPRQQIAVTAAVDLRGLPRRRPLFVDVLHADSSGRTLGGLTIVLALK